ncbi:MAG: hypothetical protein ACRDS9_23920 [Pseudonocardiaceae bacterium]
MTGFGADAIMSWRRAHRVELPDGNRTTESPKSRMTVIELWSPKRLDAIVAALDDGDFVEFGVDVLVVHRRRGNDEPPGDLRVSRVRAQTVWSSACVVAATLVCGRTA